MRLLLCLFLFSISLHASAQSNQFRTCDTDAYAEAIQQQFPELKLQQQQTNQVIQQALQQKKQQGENMEMATVSIPVVFHVVYNEPEQNISDEQIYSQLEILNADFSRTNADAANTPSYFQGVAAGVGIEFCLAVIDPDGDPTTGITRTQTNQTSFSSISDNVKFSNLGGKDAWDTSEYLNIWICNVSNKILGYATFPGATSPARDGVVLLYTSVGAAPANKFETNYNSGRTATHEVGHWLGLSHIWGNGKSSKSCSDNDDGIDDTPTQSEPTYGCPGDIVVSCENGPNGNMWQNYMDYSDDACMNLFTRGQASYMNAVLSSARASLFRSLACTGELRANFKTLHAEDTLTSAGKTVKFVDAYEGARPTSWLWEFEGGTPSSSSEQNPQVTYKEPGKYKVKLTISNDQMSSTTVKEQFMYVTSNELIIYPVPASDYIILEQPAGVEVRHVQMINHTGQLVLSARAEERLVKININHLKPGIYFLKVRSSEGIVATKRIVIAR